MKAHPQICHNSHPCLACSAHDAMHRPGRQQAAAKEVCQFSVAFNGRPYACVVVNECDPPFTCEIYIEGKLAGQNLMIGGTIVEKMRIMADLQLKHPGVLIDWQMPWWMMERFRGTIEAMREKGVLL